MPLLPLSHAGVPSAFSEERCSLAVPGSFVSALMSAEIPVPETRVSINSFGQRTCQLNYNSGDRTPMDYQVAFSKPRLNA